MELPSASEPREKFGEFKVISESEAREKLGRFKDSGSELYLSLKGTVVDLEADAFVKEVSGSHVLLVLGDGGKLNLPWNPKTCTWMDGEPDRGLFRSRCLEVTDRQGSNFRLIEKTRTAVS
jgi:hypothetical protein